MANRAGMSTTALATPIHKMCENKKCGRLFETYEPERLYCTLKCKDYAARQRRRQKERDMNEGHDPRLGSQRREIEEHLKETTLKIVNDPMSTVDIEVKVLYEAVLSG